MGKEKGSVRWLDEPEDHNYPAAASYLGLLIDEPQAAALVERLRAAPMARFKAKDILRASRLNLLGVSNAHIEKNLEKVDEGKPLSPVLLVRDPAQRMVIVADGYHRLCAVYRLDEDALIPCRIVTL